MDLSEVEKESLFNGPLFSSLGRQVFQSEFLNDFMSLDRPYWK